LVIPSIRVNRKLLQEATTWKIPPTPHSADLTAYLLAQPSTKYAGFDHDLVATDGSLRKVDSGRLMGSAAVHGNGTEKAAVRVRGACSSTRPELVGILLTIQTTPPERELWILVDSSSVISCLRCFKRETFRPPGYKVKDADVVYDILRLIQGRAGMVRLIKVNGHMGYLLHSEANALVVHVTSDSEAPFLYDAPLISSAKIASVHRWQNPTVAFFCHGSSILEPTGRVAVSADTGAERQRHSIWLPQHDWCRT
jgi:ribonuclease HI